MPTIKKAQPADAAILLAYSKKTFYDFFAPLNDPANMEAYTAIAFTRKSIVDQLSNTGSRFYFLLNGLDIVGYLKLNFNGAQTEFRDKNGMEIERVYVSREYHGKGMGKQLIDFAIDMATDKQLDYIWLGVWEHNHKAIGFYRHFGFKVFSSHNFLLGTDPQRDLLMRKNV